MLTICCKILNYKFNTKFNKKQKVSVFKISSTNAMFAKNVSLQIWHMTIWRKHLREQIDLFNFSVLFCWHVLSSFFFSFKALLRAKFSMHLPTLVPLFIFFFFSHNIFHEFLRNELFFFILYIFDMFATWWDEK